MCKDPPTQCVIETLELYLDCNNSIFNNTIYIQTDGTAHRPNMSCLYSDIAMAGHGNKTLMYDFPPKMWKRFRDDLFVVWTHGTAKFPSFLDYLNNIDETGKIEFTMQIADEANRLESLDLKIKCLNGKLSIDVYSQPTNNFTYVMPLRCYPMKNINKVPQGMALWLRRICDTTETYESRSDEYKNYLLAQDYKLFLVDEQFKKISREQEIDIKMNSSKYQEKMQGKVNLKRIKSVKSNL